MERRRRFGPYLIFKSMEQGPTFRSVPPKYPTDDPDDRIVKYIRDEGLGPLVMCVGSFLPFQTTCYSNGHHFIAGQLHSAADRLSPEIIRKRPAYRTLVLGPKFSRKDRAAIPLRRDYSLNQVESCRNFTFRRNFPIPKIFGRSCEPGLFRLTADKIAQIFGVRKHKRIRGRFHSMLEKPGHGHHVPRAYGKSLVAVTGRMAGFEAELLNVPVDFPLFQRPARPIPRHSDEAPEGGAAPRRHSTRRWADSADPRGHTGRLGPLRGCLQPDPSPL